MPTAISNLSELSDMDISVHISTAMPQRWADKTEWSGYKNTPRPNCGLIYVADDLQILFKTQNSNIITAKKGDLIYAPRGSKYNVIFDIPKAVPTASYVINFSIKDSKGNDIYLSDEMKCIFSEKKPILEAKINELCVIKTDIIARNLRLSSIFLDMLDYIITETKNNSTDYYPIRRGVELLSKEWQKNERISRYSDACSVSESYFYLLFKKSMGMSPVEYRNKIRILNAKAMLKNTPASVSEISENIGFEDPFFFSRIFKKQVGISPSAYRARRK